MLKLKQFSIHINEAYGDNEYSEVIYAYCKDAAYGASLKVAGEMGFEFPVISIEEGR